MSLETSNCLRTVDVDNVEETEEMEEVEEVLNVGMDLGMDLGGDLVMEAEGDKGGDVDRDLVPLLFIFEKAEGDLDNNALFI